MAIWGLETSAPHFASLFVWKKGVVFGHGFGTEWSMYIHSISTSAWSRIIPSCRREQHVRELAKDNPTHYTQKSFVTFFDGHFTIEMTGPTLGSTSPEHGPYGHLPETYTTRTRCKMTITFLAMTFFKILAEWKQGAKSSAHLHPGRPRKSSDSWPFRCILALQVIYIYIYIWKYICCLEVKRSWKKHLTS